MARQRKPVTGIDQGLASRVNNLIGVFAPSLALSREKARLQRDVLMQGASHYNAAGRGDRSKDFRANRSDAREAARHERERLSWIGRDMLRNNPRVVRIRRALMNQVVGAGIQPSVRWIGPEVITPDGVTDQARVEALIRKHCLTVAWDADGLRSMLGQQGLGFGSIVGDGEVLFRRRFRRVEDGLPLPFQVQVLEPDFLNKDVDGPLPNGNFAVQGIEFNAIGKRVAYHLFKDHPGGRWGAMPATARVSAENIIHAFDVTRPGQARGVSWLAPVLPMLHELQKYQDGQVKRQEIAALFAGVMNLNETGADLEGEIGTLEAGTILKIGSDEQMQFTDPPSVDGYEPFMRATDRTIAAAMGITYEALTGDYSNVNYTSGRMGRMDVDPNIRDWQQNLMIAQVCAGFARWIAEGVNDVADIAPDTWEVVWTPPVRPVIDPTKDYKANETRMRSGQVSRRQVIRESGGDPDKIEAEIEKERIWETEKGVTLTSNAGAAAPTPADTANKEEGADDAT